MPPQAMHIPAAFPPRLRACRAVFSRTVFICTVACFMVLASRASAHEAPSGSEGRWTASSLQQLVDRFRTLLGIDPAVIVSIVPVNPKVASMVPPGGPGQPFQLAIERGFLDALSADELSAVVAHELGHVWVSTHHPYLQTEELANSVAMRVVTRESLERVYTKMWARDGSSGDLVKFLGPSSSESAALAPNK